MCYVYYLVEEQVFLVFFLQQGEAYLSYLLALFFLLKTELYSVVQLIFY